MTRSSSSLAGAPPESLRMLAGLGQRLRAHRLQQVQTIEEMAARLFCSPTTYRALEAGKPGTSMGILAHALWLLGQLDTLDNVAPLTTGFAAGVAAGKRVRRRTGQAAPGTISEPERDF
ncbi:helix-turn-helix domain-containing protein [Variovorax terrae]|uniref:Helix-turn-helix domain-containing protein n=1 Tax=Variovorax terrae TaxID=2923278 RepID=A0A9X2ANZ6_9BURK|nr:helix-turn-helix transcriptional regulator [Variovorax terrae]MCJ0762922.1 helix-turn-helix domain-containing protein [Variovorax terrae]